MTSLRQQPAFWFILIVAALFRLPGLGSVPPPLHWDEASRGYDAWCLLETGMDRHGQAWPYFLKSFGEGDWTAALSTYLTIPFVALLGPNEWAIRLPDAILGVVTVAGMFFLLRRALSPAAALCGMVVMATDPWHIGLCRTGHEAGYAPFFLVFSLLSMQRCRFASDAPSDTAASAPVDPFGPAYGFVCGVMFAMHAWVYPATRLFTPLFMLAIVLIYRRPIQDCLAAASKRFNVFGFLSGMVVGSAPLWITAMSNPQRLAARGRVTILAADGLTATDRIGEFAGNYAANLSPAYQFFRCDELSGMTMHGIGLHFIVAAPLILIGLVIAFRLCSVSRWHRLIVAWFLLYPIPAAICRDWNPHPFRTVAGVALYPILAAIGWQWISHLAESWSSSTRRMAIAVAGFSLTLNAGWFADVYFRRMPPRLEQGYQTALVRAMQFVAEHGDEADFVLVTRWFNQPYIYAMLYGPVPPETLADLPKLEGEDLQGFHQVNRIGKYYFPPREPEKTPDLARVFQQDFNSLPADAEGMVIELAGRFGAGKVLAEFGNRQEYRDMVPLEVRWWRRSDDPIPPGGSEGAK